MLTIICGSVNAMQISNESITQTGNEFEFSADVTDALGGVVSYMVYDKDSRYYFGDCDVVNNKVFFTFAMPDNASYGDYTIDVGGIKTSPASFDFSYSEDSVFEGEIKSGTLSVDVGEPFEIFELGEYIDIAVKWENESESKKTIILEVTDYFGNTVYKKHKNVSQTAESCEFIVEHDKTGHFNVKASIMEESATANYAVTYSANERNYDEKGTIGVCTAGIELMGTDFGYIENFAESLKLAGVSDVREIVRWFKTEKSPGVYNFAQYDDWINEYKEKGISVLTMFDYTPYAYRKSVDGYKLPDNLFGVYNFANSISEYFKGRVDFWEIYNEVDMGNSGTFTAGDTANQYASVLKAAYHGIKNGNRDAKVSIAGLSDTYAGFFEKLMMNDINKYFDIYNFHHHVQSTSADYPVFSDINKNHYKHILEYGLEDKEVWVTEAGIYMPVESKEYELTKEEQTVQARYAVTSAVTSLSQGADKHFWFTWPHYVEGMTELGTFSNRMQPYSSYSAISALTKVLNGKDYVGKIKNDNADIKGYAFSNKEESTVCLWSKNPATVSLELGRHQITLVDIMGNEQILYSDDGVYDINVGPDMYYLILDGEYPVSMLDLADIKKNEVKENISGLADKIVLKQNFGTNAEVNARNDSYKITDGEVLTLDVYNFNDSEVSGVINSETFGEYEVIPKSTEITIPAKEKLTLNFTLNINAETADTVPLIFNGNFNGEKTSDSVSLISSNTLQNVVISEIENYRNPSSWRHNTYSSAVKKAEQTADGNIKFSYSFTDKIVETGNIYAYPEIEVESGECAESDGVCFNIKTDVTDLNFKCYVYEENGSVYKTHIGYDVKESGTHNIRFKWSDFSASGNVFDENNNLDVDNIKKIRIGFNTKTQQNVDYILSDFGVYVAEKPLVAVHSSASDVYYADGKLFSEFSESLVPIKEDTLRYIVNNSYALDGTFDSGSWFASNGGEYDITVCVLDKSNRLIKLSKDVTVDESGFLIQNAVFDKSTVYGAENLTFSGSIKNVDSDTEDVTIICALYDSEGCLITTNHTEKKIPKNTSQPFEIALNDISNDTNYIKVFFWQNWSNVAPVAESINLN